MKIAVIGAGIVGITTAYELAVDGHEVSVFERRSAAAEETSFANAGVVAPGYITPWAAPGMPARALLSLFKRHAPVRISLPLSLSEMAWMGRWVRCCKLDSYLTNRARLQRLAFYSRARLDHLTERLELDYDRSQGYLVLLRSEKDRRRIQVGLQSLRESGVACDEISAEQVRLLEPAISVDTPLVGAINLPEDGVANCRQFALLLKNQALRAGVNFEFNTPVHCLDREHANHLWIKGDSQARIFDAVVMCAGQTSAELLRPLGLKIPMVAVYGYSISAAIREPLNAPRSALMDERYKVAISRLGNRVRVAGGAELGGRSASSRAASIQTLYKVLHDWFPGAAQHSSRESNVQEWKGARAMLPDGPPLICQSGRPGLWLNIGHGSSGWALSCGSARLVADLVAGQAPEIDTEGFGLDRLR